MNDPLDKLFATARQTRPDTSRIELGFETRLMARLREEQSELTSWFAMSWRLAPAFAAVVIALGVWNFTDNTSMDATLTYSERSADVAVASYLTGE